MEATSLVDVLSALLGVSAIHGIDRQDTFEIIAIVTVWLALVVAAAMMAAVFRHPTAPNRGEGR